MKIELNYDLMDKIAEAKDTCKLKRYNKESLRMVIPAWIFAAIPSNIIIGNIQNYTPEQIILNTLGSAGISYLMITTALVLSTKVTEKVTGTTYQELAMGRLNLLSLDLTKQHVKTSLELLLDSKMYDKKSNFILTEKGISGIMQKKYINVPSYNNGNIEETSIVQEHKIGTKKYVLSLGSPTKAKVFKPAYGI